MAGVIPIHHPPVPEDVRYAITHQRNGRLGHVPAPLDGPRAVDVRVLVDEAAFRPLGYDQRPS